MATNLCESLAVEHSWVAITRGYNTTVDECSNCKIRKTVITIKSISTNYDRSKEVVVEDKDIATTIDLPTKGNVVTTAPTVIKP